MGFSNVSRTDFVTKKLRKLIILSNVGKPEIDDRFIRKNEMEDSFWIRENMNKIPLI